MAGGCIVPDDAPSYERKGGEPREQAAEPRESIRAEEQMHWVREEFRGRLQQMVQLRADKPGQARKRDQGFGIAGIFGCDTTASQVGAQHEICGEHCASDHQAEGGYSERTDVQERDHRKQYNVNVLRGSAAGGG